MPSQRVLSMPSLIIHKTLVKYEFVVWCASKMFLINIYVWFELNYNCYLHLNERPHNYYFTFNVVVVCPKKLYSSQSELLIYLTAIPSQILYHNLSLKLSIFVRLLFTFPFSGWAPSSLCLAKNEQAKCEWGRKWQREKDRERQSKSQQLFAETKWASRHGRGPPIQIPDSRIEHKSARAHYNNEQRELYTNLITKWNYFGYNHLYIC